MQTNVDPKRIEELAAYMKQLARTIEDRETDLHRDLSQLITGIENEYTSAEVGATTSGITKLLHAIRSSAESITVELNKKARVLQEASEQYLREEKNHQQFIQQSVDLFGQWSYSLRELQQDNPFVSLLQKLLPPSVRTLISATVTATDITYRQHNDELRQDPVVLNLMSLLEEGTKEEREYAGRALGKIYEARNTIARHQYAYEVYIAYGQVHLAERVHEQAEWKREILRGYGINGELFESGIDLKIYYYGNAIQACEYDPSIMIEEDGKPVLIPMPEDKYYHLLLDMGLDGGEAGNWAKGELLTIHRMMADIGGMQVRGIYESGTDRCSLCSERRRDEDSNVSSR